MEEKERYIVKKLTRDCLFPETLCELKDEESKFFVILESIEDANKIKDLLNKQDNEINVLNELLSSEQKFHDWCLKDFEEETEKLRRQIKELKGEK